MGFEDVVFIIEEVRKFSLAFIIYKFSAKMMRSYLLQEPRPIYLQPVEELLFPEVSKQVTFLSHAAVEVSLPSLTPLVHALSFNHLDYSDNPRNHKLPRYVLITTFHFYRPGQHGVSM